MKIGNLVRHNYGMTLHNIFSYGIVIDIIKAGLYKEIFMCKVYWFNGGDPGVYKSDDLELISECKE